MLLQSKIRKPFVEVNGELVQKLPLNHFPLNVKLTFSFFFFA